MSTFRPGLGQPAVSVQRAVWPTLEPGTVRVWATAPAAEHPAPVEQRATAEELVQEARLQAADILQQAAAAAEAAVAEARREGYEAGRHEGAAAAGAELEMQRQKAQFELERARVQSDAMRQAAEAEARAIRAEAEAQMHALLGSAREEAAELSAAARAEQARYLDDAKEALVELAVAAAMRIVQGHLAVQPAAIVAMVTAGLRRLKDSHCTVRVSPHDLPLLHAQRSTLERELGAGSLKLQPDPGLHSGSYTVVSSQGQIDGTLEQQTVQLRSALAAAIGGD